MSIITTWFRNSINPYLINVWGAISNVNTRTSLAYFNANFVMSATGGGTVSHIANRLKWSNRFIAIPLAKVNSANSATDGYYSIVMPPVDTVIHGLGSTADDTVTADGMLLNNWEAIYYKVPKNHTQGTVNENFYRLNYSESNTEIPDDFILIATRNGDVSSSYEIKLITGRVLKANSGSSIREFTVDKMNKADGLANRLLKSKGDGHSQVTDVSILSNSRIRAIAYQGGNQLPHQFFAVQQKRYNGNNTGAFVLSLPVQAQKQSTMLTVQVDIYDYETNKSARFLISGYDYSGDGGKRWYNESATVTGNSPAYNVWLGYDDNIGRKVICIGTDTTLWRYPNISITYVSAGHSGGVYDFGYGWGIELRTDFSDIINVRRPWLPRNKEPLRLTFQNNWVDYNGAYDGGFYTIRDGMCYLSGLIKDGDANSIIATLPIEARPSGRHIFSVSTGSGPKRLDVNIDGAIHYESADVVSWLSLSGLSYPIRKGTY